MPESEETLATIRTTVSRVIAAAERGDIADPGRTAVIEALRIATDADYRRLVASSRWRDYLALRATCEGLPDGELRAELTAELRRSDRDFAADRGRIYARVTQALGYRVQVPGLGEDASLELMSSTLGALMSGLIIGGGGAGTDDTDDADDADDSFMAKAFGSEIDGRWNAASYALTSSFLTFLAPPTVPSLGVDLQSALTEL